MSQFSNVSKWKKSSFSKILNMIFKLKVRVHCNAYILNLLTKGNRDTIHFQDEVSEILSGIF